MFMQEEYFKNIFNTVRDGILVLDENLKVLSANRSFFNIFKVDTANTIGSLLYDMGNGQWNIPYLRVLLEDILPKNNTVDDYKIEHNFESIGHKIMLLNARKIIENKNDPPIILLVIEDITERKILEDLLTESEVRYKRLFETASDGILLLDKSEGTISQANPAAEKMLGCSKEECIGKNLQDLGVSIDMSDFPTIMHALDRSGIIHYDDVLVKTKSGPIIYTDIYMVDKATLAQCNIRDITERKEAAEALRRRNEELEQKSAVRTADLEAVNKELEAFSYSVSHDLRAPLRHISGFVKMLQQNLEDHPDDRTHKYVNTIAEASNKMSMLIDDLLGFSHSGRSEMRKRKVNLNTLVKGVVREIQEDLKERVIRWELYELPEVLGDKSLLRLVFINLVSNAVKFTSTRPQAEIRIGCKDEEDRFTCSVADNGVGFDMKYVKKLFGVFQRLHPQDEFEGTGIGLANVQRIISRHGGRTWAEGSVGEGATFYFTLPR